MLNTYLDRRFDNDFPGVNPTYSAPNTTWTLPYSVATDGSEGTIMVIRKSTGVPITVVRPTATTVRATGDLSAVDVWIGISYGFRIEFSVIYRRDRNTGAPDIRGRTALRYVKLFYEDATQFTVVVTSLGRDARTYTFASADPLVPESGIFHIPVLSRNTETAIVVTSSSAGAVGFSGYEWEGTMYTRTSRG